MLYKDLRYLILILSLLFLSDNAKCQSDSVLQKKDTLPERLHVLNKVNRNGEELPEIEIKEVTILANQKGKDAREQRNFLKRYERLVYNLKKVYPYALIVRDRLYMANLELTDLPDEKARRTYLKELEKSVFNEYEDDMRKLTITQGKLLIKLVDRETQNTSYQLIKDYRGAFSAAFWQGIARIFGTNLKAEYDPYGEDAITEIILLDIEAGLL